MTGILTAVVLIVLGTVIGVAASGTKVSNTPSSPATTPPAAVQPSTAQPSTPATTTPPETVPAPAPPPTAVTYTGVGAKVLKINKRSGPMALTMKHAGSSNFAVWSLDSSGNKIGLLVNTIGNYSGTRLIDALQGQQTAALQIEADGNWSVTLKRVVTLRVWDGTGTWTGKGDDLVLIQSGAFSGLDSVQITNSGQSNFAVWAHGDTQELLVNEIGPYSGEHLMPAGTALLQIESDGTWSLHKA